jgi:hypothetical protein
MTNRETLRDQWRAVASGLSIRIVAPYVLHLADGSELEFSALLPQFGSPHGMLIDPEPTPEAIEAAIAAGFGFSTMDPETHHLPISPLDYVDCLVDWGWSDSGTAPQWYVDAA